MSTDQTTVVFLVTAALAPFLWAALALYRSPYTPWQSLWYFANLLLTRLLWRADVPKTLPVPAGQGAVIVANHRSSVDPFFIQLAAGRVVHWMVAEEYFAVPFVGLFLRTTQAIPTRRTGRDMAATRLAIRYVAQGELVGIMPEGRINATDQLLLPVRPGAVLIAMSAGAPIVPCHIEGAPYGNLPWSPLVMPARVRVTFGTPVETKRYQGREREPRLAEQLILEVMSEICRLAGQENFRTPLAGKRWNPAEQVPEQSTAEPTLRERG